MGVGGRVAGAPGSNGHERREERGPGGRWALRAGVDAGQELGEAPLGIIPRCDSMS